MAIKWYFVRCQSGREDSIARNAITRLKIAGLQDVVPQVLVPFEKVTDLKNGKQRACKAMRLPTPLDREDFRHEVSILMKIKTHKNICHAVDSAEDARFGYLVMQSCTGGELFDRIAARNCTEKDAAMAVLDALSALDFIHSKRIIHHDLKVCRRTGGVLAPHARTSNPSRD